MTKAHIDAEKTKALIDTNICIDLVRRDRAYSKDAIELFLLCENRSVNGIVAGHAFDTIFYIIQRDRGIEKALSAVRLFHRVVSVGQINQWVIDQSVASGWNDFEDAIHHYCAVYELCDVIVTRNQRDFQSADIPVVTPYEFLTKYAGRDY